MADCEFLAENTSLVVVPNFKHGHLRFLSGNFGPFGPQTNVILPLWLANWLEQRGSCQVIAPNFLDIESLNTHHREEMNAEDSFVQVPDHYSQVHSLIFEKNRGNEAISSRLEDINIIRADKIRKGLIGIANQAANDEFTYSVRITNMQPIEINRMRKQLTSTLRHFGNLRAVALPVNHVDGQKSSSNSSTLLKKRSRDEAF
mmetsp:Transcript_19248/g.24985  ORF Transcript_19248/g.24985 Transcript_19248/m.24985 type:complete len:202 (+) Transcript_19248:48-653(+)